jgi:hypothetical protein
VASCEAFAARCFEALSMQRGGTITVAVWPNANLNVLIGRHPKTQEALNMASLLLKPLDSTAKPASHESSGYRWSLWRTPGQNSLNSCQTMSETMAVDPR